MSVVFLLGDEWDVQGQVWGCVCVCACGVSMGWMGRGERREIPSHQEAGGLINQEAETWSRSLSPPPPLCRCLSSCCCSDALKWAEASLDLMQTVAELPRAHPALEPHIQLVIELKHKTGGWVCRWVCVCVGVGVFHCWACIPPLPCCPGRRQDI